MSIRFENPRQHLRADPNAVVPHADRHHLGGRVDRQPDPPPNRVYLAALVKRLVRICSIRDGCPSITTASAGRRNRKLMASAHQHRPRDVDRPRHHLRQIHLLRPEPAHPRAGADTNPAHLR